MTTSPYSNTSPSDWFPITESLIKEHPLSEQEIVEIVLVTWKSIFASTFGNSRFKIGVDIFPKPQIMGFFLHELIPLELESRYNHEWMRDEAKLDKDCVNINRPEYSFEIKTSSNKTKIFGNRSYAQTSKGSRKTKDGYYLTVNFEKFSSSNKHPDILLIRFGWIDSTDWRGQKAATGQQSSLPPQVYDGKLKILHSLI